MEQGLPRGAFSTAARLMGMMALMPVIYYWRIAFLSLSGGDPIDSGILVNCAAGTGVSIGLAAFMISPTLAVSFVRRRMDWPGRIGFFLLKAMYAGVVPLHFIITVADFGFLQPIIYFVWLGVGSIAATFFIGSVFPGDLARALARRDAQQVVDRRLRSVAALRDAPSTFEMAHPQEQEVYRVSFPQASPDPVAAPVEAVPAKPKKKKVKYESDGPNPLLELLGAPLLLLGVALFLMSIHGRLYTSFAPNADLVDLYAEYKAIIAVIMGACGYLGAVLYFNRGLSALPALGQWWRALAAAAIYAALSFFFGSAIYLKSAPELLAQIEDEAPESRVSVYLVEQGAETQPGSCSYSAQVSWREDLSGHAFQICDLEPKLWKALRPGQRVTLIGTKTPFGFRYHTATGLILG